jgi:hypothetical protein
LYSSSIRCRVLKLRAFLDDFHVVDEEQLGASLVDPDEVTKDDPLPNTLNNIKSLPPPLPGFAWELGRRLQVDIHRVLGSGCQSGEQ